ncbi:hypothetical protein T265_14712, partial [Opisthorchis viverrini]
MGCDLSKVYNVDIHLENELAVFEPRDEVAGHVIIQAEEDTVIDIQLQGRNTPPGPTGAIIHPRVALHLLWRRQYSKHTQLYPDKQGTFGKIFLGNAPICKARAAFANLRHLWRQNGLSLNLKGRVYQTTVRAVLLYGCETWPIRAADLR